MRAGSAAPFMHACRLTPGFALSPRWARLQEEAASAPNLKILEAAYQWKRQRMAAADGEGDAGGDGASGSGGGGGES